MKKHICEDWVNDGVGCAICSKILRGLKGDEVVKAAQLTNWLLTELRLTGKELISASKGLQCAPRSNNISENIRLNGAIKEFNSIMQTTKEITKK